MRKLMKWLLLFSSVWKRRWNTKHEFLKWLLNWRLIANQRKRENKRIRESKNHKSMWFLFCLFSAECTIGMVRGLTPLKHYGATALWLKNVVCSFQTISCLLSFKEWNEWISSVACLFPPLWEKNKKFTNVFTRNISELAALKLVMSWQNKLPKYCCRHCGIYGNHK